MPSTSSFTSTGALQYVGKQNFVATPLIVTSPNPFQNLLSCYIVTDVQNISFNLKVNGVVIGHFINDNIVSWDVSGVNVTIKTKDEVFYQLVFVTTPEALLADQRINSNINGSITAQC